MVAHPGSVTRSRRSLQRGSSTRPSITTSYPVGGVEGDKEGTGVASIHNEWNEGKGGEEFLTHSLSSAVMAL